jgi:ABC-type sugar transport system permease subunit
MRRRAETRLAWLFVTPALAAVASMAIFPLGWTLWESLHRHDLRMPWLGKPFIGFANYADIARDPRFWSAIAHTTFFTAATVALEILLGLFLALAMNRASRGRGAVRAAILVPWSIPTVVAALLWRFLFDSQSGPISPMLERIGITEEPLVWFVDVATAWVPIIIADVWKTTPFVALLLLAGLQNISHDLYESASVDGARPAAQLWHITLPLLRPALLVALIFRTLDAFRVFDLVYVLTAGGPGTATEPIALYTFNALFQNLRSGYASALSVIVFFITFVIALVYIRVLETKESG